LLDTTLEVVEAEVGTLRRLVSEFSDFARLPNASLASVDLAEFLRELERQFAAFPGQWLNDDGGALKEQAESLEGITLSFRVPDAGVLVALDVQLFRRVIVNLVRNAAQAMREAGKVGNIEVALEVAAGAPQLFVDDDGPGIPDGIRPRLFEPYATTRRKGTGLGLAIVQKIVMEHGATVSAGASPLGGARIQIVFPLDAESAAPPSSRSRA
jgi:signal transduction histidine kinase